MVLGKKNAPTFDPQHRVSLSCLAIRLELSHPPPRPPKFRRRHQAHNCERNSEPLKHRWVSLSCEAIGLFINCNSHNFSATASPPPFPRPNSRGDTRQTNSERTSEPLKYRRVSSSCEAFYQLPLPLLLSHRLPPPFL